MPIACRSKSSRRRRWAGERGGSCAGPGARCAWPAAFERMKVLYAVWTFPAPSETFVLNQITGLIERGHDVSIIALSGQASGAVHDDVKRYGLLERTTYLASPPIERTPRLRAGARLLARSAVERTGLWRALDPRFGRMAL